MVALRDRSQSDRALIIIATFTTLVILVFVGIRIGMEPDWGGVISLAITLALFFFFNIDGTIRNGVERPSQGIYHEKFTVKAILLLLGLVVIWLSFRSMMLLLKNLLFEEGYLYSVIEIFSIISFILSANLCFTLANVVQKSIDQDQKPEAGNSPKEKDKEQGKRADSKETNFVGNLIEVATQVVIIGFIALLPRYNDTNLQATTGFIGYLALTGFFLAAIFVCMTIRKRYCRQETAQSSTGDLSA